MRNVSDKSCRENPNTHFMFNNFFFQNCAFYEIMWKYLLRSDGTNDNITRRVRVACCIRMQTRTQDM